MMNKAAQLADNILGKKRVAEGSAEADSGINLMRAVVWQGTKSVSCGKVFYSNSLIFPCLCSNGPQTNCYARL
jgi:hypothetical protein